MLRASWHSVALFSRRQRCSRSATHSEHVPQYLDVGRIDRRRDLRCEHETVRCGVEILLCALAEVVEVGTSQRLAGNEQPTGPGDLESADSPEAGSDSNTTTSNSRPVCISENISSISSTRPATALNRRMSSGLTSSTTRFPRSRYRSLRSREPLLRSSCPS